MNRVNLLTARKRDLFRHRVKQNIIIDEYSSNLIASGMSHSDIKEWHIELRDNELSMGEENIKAKKKKLDHEEVSLDEQLAEERKERDQREQKLAKQEKEVAETRDSLRKLEFEFKERNAILEIMLKVCLIIHDAFCRRCDNVLTMPLSITNRDHESFINYRSTTNGRR